MSHSSSLNGSKPNYLRVSWWQKKENRFWLRRNPDPNMRYNVAMYEAMLSDTIKAHRNTATL